MSDAPPRVVNVYLSGMNRQAADVVYRTDARLGVDEEVEELARLVAAHLTANELPGTEGRAAATRSWAGRR